MRCERYSSLAAFASADCVSLMWVWKATQHGMESTSLPRG